MNKGSFGLEDQVCVVTGAGGGAGRGIALVLAAEGAKVAVLDINEAGARETASLIEEARGVAQALRCDVTDNASVEDAATRIIDKLGEPNVLINNAAGVRAKPLDELSIEDWEATLSLNLTAYLRSAQIFSRGMRKNGGGALVHISSAAGNYITPFSGAYNVSKVGVNVLSRQLAAEWGPMGIRSNVIIPGFIYTPLSKPIYDNPGMMEHRVGLVPSRRIGQPEDIGQAALFLASPRASYVNGAEIMVDGGMTKNLLSQVTPRLDKQHNTAVKG